ncbi:hypothetical protein RhiirB3_503735 [Rhizophagus irregularis]|nr:hypothetical protein RhiirB3_503735 [Rhizophagus irregularis]
MTKDGKQLTAEEWNKEKTQIIDEMKACVEQSREKVNEANFLLKESTDARDKAKARIKSLENDLKIERVQIKSLENDVRILEQEKKKVTSEVATSSKMKSKTKSHNRRRKSKNKQSSTQEIKKGKITEIPVQQTSDDNYLEKYFAAQSHDLKFYDFPAYWKDELYTSRFGSRFNLELL